MIPLNWSDNGPKNEQNAYGKLVQNDGNPIICTHGGTMWLCHSCAIQIYAANRHSLKWLIPPNRTKTDIAFIPQQDTKVQDDRPWPRSRTPKPRG